MRTQTLELRSTPAPPVRRGAGGYDFAVDPNLRADEAEIFWLPELHASSVILVASPISPASDVDATRPSSDAPCASDLLSHPKLVAHRISDDGEHVLLHSGRDQCQLWLTDPQSGGGQLAAVILLDEFAPHRAEAALRFWRLLRDKAPGRAKHPPHARRVLSFLRALDGHLGRASYRQIAQCLFGRARVAVDPWKTSSLRDATIRLVRGGVALMGGGYRKFLKK
jgi:hypothetical protein